MILWLAVLISFSLLFSMPAAGSDDDERPAYMIYIDPETGKYTTEDPYGNAEEKTNPGTENTGLKVTAIIAGALLIMVVAGYALRTNGRQKR